LALAHFGLAATGMIPRSAAQETPAATADTHPFRPPKASVRSGASMTSPNIGREGTLDILEGAGSSHVWSYDIASDAWSALWNPPVAVTAGGAISNLFNSCDFAFAGGGSRIFFTTGTNCAEPQILADAPEPVVARAGLAAAPGLVGAPTDYLFALRGSGASDFWRYEISTNTWKAMPITPAAVGDGAALVEVFNCGSGSPNSSKFQVAALRGANTRDFWCFDIAQGVWLSGPGMPPTPAPVGPGGSVAQLQHLGRIYALRGAGTSDFWQFAAGQWTPLAATPGPVSSGASLVGVNYGTNSQRDVLYALQGGASPAIWKYDVELDTWTYVADVPTPHGRVQR
jgi:hypothetical protein